MTCDFQKTAYQLEASYTECYERYFMLQKRHYQLWHRHPYELGYPDRDGNNQPDCTHPQHNK